MLIEFDQNIMANMTAALAYVCERIPADKDRYDTRKRIADAMIASAHSGWRTLNDFQNVGLKVLAEITRAVQIQKVRSGASDATQIGSRRRAGALFHSSAWGQRCSRMTLSLVFDEGPRV
jgi:hypothetical protein